MESNNIPDLNKISNNEIKDNIGDIEVEGTAKEIKKPEPVTNNTEEKKNVDFKDVTLGKNSSGINLDKVKFMIIPIVLFLIGILVVIFITFPKAQEYYKNIAVVKEKEEKNNILTEKFGILKQFSSVENALDENSVVLTQAIPTEQTVPQFMTLVQEISKVSGVDLKSLTYSGTAPTSEKSTLATNGLSTIELVYIQGSAVGDYNAIKTFVRNLEGSLRIMNIDNVRLASNSSSDEKKEALVNLSFAITAYSAAIQAQPIAEQPLNFNLTDGNFSKVLDFLKGQNEYNVDVPNTGIGKLDPFSN